MHTKDFKKINKKDIRIAGGKGASLGEMINNKIPVPGGFVLLSSAFEDFIKKEGLNNKINSIIKSVDTKEIDLVNNASKKIYSLILNGDIPIQMKNEIMNKFEKLNSDYVAIRSSATAEDGVENAWAGQLDSFLNIKRGEIIENIKKCWASLFTPRAIFYRFNKGMHEKKISTAVVIQKMVNSEKSGIAFSVHPVTEDYNQIIIEAGWGLGEAIVSGKITPDSYIIKKTTKQIIGKNIAIQKKGLFRSKKHNNEWRKIEKSIGRKQVLSNEEILNLTKVVVKIEKHYKIPQDIEWAMENDTFFILQSRPITTLKNF